MSQRDNMAIAKSGKSMKNIRNGWNKNRESLSQLFVFDKYIDAYA